MPPPSLAIDRIAPTLRPAARAAGSQKWRDLLFMHWPVAQDALRPLVPRDLELDLHDGVAYVGLVPFSMREVRPRWLPAFASFDFLETNVRVYVHHRGAPGVFFLSLEAASAIACATARATFGLPYFWAHMRTRAEAGGLVDHQTRRRLGSSARHHVRYRVGDALGPSAAGTLEHFLLERYYLFVERGGRIQRGQVHHTPYPVHRAEILSVEDELITASGLPAVTAAPAHAHWSPGVDVEVFALR